MVRNLCFFHVTDRQRFVEEGGKFSPLLVSACPCWFRQRILYFSVTIQSARCLLTRPRTEVSGKWRENYQKYSAFCSGTIFRRSHKSTPLNLSRLQMCTKKATWGYATPPLGYRRSKLSCIILPNIIKIRQRTRSPIECAKIDRFWKQLYVTVTVVHKV